MRSGARVKRPFTRYMVTADDVDSGRVVGERLLHKQRWSAEVLHKYLGER